MSPSSPNGGNGRDGRGRFAKGNPGGPGNPHARHVGQLRSTLLAAVTTEDIEAVVGKLIELAKNGNIQAAKEILDRCLGKSVQPIGTAGEVETRPVRIALELAEPPVKANRLTIDSRRGDTSNGLDALECEQDG